MRERSILVLSLLALTLAGCGGQNETPAVAEAALSTQVGRSMAEPGESGLLGRPPVIDHASAASETAAQMSRQSALMVGAPISVDTGDREAVRRLYTQVYMDSPVDIGWTGNYLTGIAGTTSPDFQRSTLQRINWYRAMAGVPTSATLSAATGAKAQQAAFMMSANNMLDHFPSTTWKFYTPEGAEAAKSSNIAIGYHGPAAIDAYMKDWGPDNGPVGHRRWILFPNMRTFGTGDVPPATVNGQRLRGSNALWVADADFSANRPQVRDGFVAWPTRGYVPYQTVYQRWSFSYPGADFSKAQVAVTLNGSPLGIKMETIVRGYGDNTVVWQMPGISDNGQHAQPDADTKYRVTVSNVIVDQQPRSFTYDVIVFDAGPAPKGPYSAYTVIMQGSTLTLIDNTGKEGIQTVKNPSRIDFADVSLAFDIEGNAGKAYRLYRAAFNRKPDAVGLGFWINAMDHGTPMLSVSKDFAGSPEFASLYGVSPTHAQIVQALYRNVLHREPDANGAAFWLQALANGLSVQQLLIDFSESPENKAQVAAEIKSGIVYQRFGQ